MFAPTIDALAIWNVPCELNGSLDTLPVNAKYLAPCFTLISVIDGL